jgi:hypothetical protein
MSSFHARPIFANFQNDHNVADEQARQPSQAIVLALLTATSSALITKLDAWKWHGPLLPRLVYVVYHYGPRVSVSYMYCAQFTPVEVPQEMDRAFYRMGDDMNWLGR